MVTLSDIRVSAFVNILGAFTFLLAFALLRIQPLNDSVYFPKWYLKGQRTSPGRAASCGYISKFVNLYFWAYFTFLNWILNWMHQALRMSENDLIHHAGLDSAAFPKIYTLGKYEDKSNMRWSSTCSSSKGPRKNIRELPLSIGVCLSLGGEPT